MIVHINYEHHRGPQVSANRLALLWHCHIAEKVSLTYIQCHDNELCHRVGVGWVEPEDSEVSADELGRYENNERKPR